MEANRNDNKKISEATRKEIIERSCKQVSRGVFFSTLIIVTSFLPVFLLTGQEGKLFHPLAITKTVVMVVDALLVITLAPVLIKLFMKGNFKTEKTNPVNRIFEKLYEPILAFCIHHKKITLGVNIAALAISLPLLFSIGREFMPPLDEGSILFMPVTLPDVSNTEVKRILQTQDKIIRSVPEVAHVLGKAGRAKTATDNAPISMIETIILLKPTREWRKGITKDDIVNELHAKLQIPGVTNGWTQPIINRVNMLSTGIRTDVGVKIFGQRLDSIQRIADKIKKTLTQVEGVKDLYVEPLTGGKFLDIQIRRQDLIPYQLTVNDVNAVIESALGGMELTTMLDGRRRVSVNARYAQDFRNNIAALGEIQISSPKGFVSLRDVADVQVVEGPSMINSENAMLRGVVLFNVRGRDMGSVISEAQKKLNQSFAQLPTGYYIAWSGQYENLIRSEKTLQWIMPLVILIIFVSMYFAFHSWREAFLSLISIPFALVGGVFMIYGWGVNMSVAVAVGFIALFGLAVETGIVMVIYLNDAMQQLVREKGNSAEKISQTDLEKYVMHGAAKRLRPKLMTVAVTLFGLVPILWSHDVGSDVMKPIVLPMVGGVFTSAVHILLVTPVIYLMSKQYELKKFGRLQLTETNE